MAPQHETPVAVRASLTLILALAAVASFASACHSAPNTAAVAASPVATRTLGDTSVYGVQILALDRPKEAATVSLRSPAELIVLAVVPGRDIELIMPSAQTKETRASFANGVSTVDLARWDNSSSLGSGNMYTQCLRRGEETQRGATQRRAKGDTTGKYLDDGRTAAELDGVARQMQKDCDKLDPGKSANAAGAVRMPPRAPADRYLVVLASSSPLTAAQLGERLKTITPTGADVATMMDDIASRLYAGQTGTWSGGYIAW
jgi:hypothetical protein